MAGPKKNSIYGDSSNMPGGSGTGLGSRSRPISKTGSPKKTVGSVARNVKTAITNPTSPNTRTGNAVRTAKVAKDYMGSPKGASKVRLPAAAARTYKAAKKDPTGMGASLRRNPIAQNAGLNSSKAVVGRNIKK